MAMKMRPAKDDPNYWFKKQSEFDKPYKGRSHPDVEYSFDFPNLTFGWPDFGGDVTPGYYDDLDKLNWNANFYCSISPCYCEGTEKCFDSGCTWRVVAVEVVEGRISVSGTNRICIKGETGYEGTAEIRIIQAFGPGELTDGRTIYGNQYVFVPPCDEDECCACSGNELINYTSQTMTVSTSDTLTITNQSAGNDCYAWEISGSGFAFDGTDGSQTTAEGGSVTLYAPSANAECTHSGTTVSLLCSGNVIDTVSFSVSAAGHDPNAVAYVDCPPCSYRPGGAACAWVHDWYCVCGRYNCYGTYVNSGNYCCVGNSEADCQACAAQSVCNATNDIRSAPRITAGCCPEAVA